MVADPTRIAKLIPERSTEDISGPGHRQAIGWLGASLPALVILLDRRRPTAGLEPPQLDSISAYAWSEGVIAFAGILAAMSIYLLTYKGYRTPDGWKDRFASIFAGAMAALVVIFPTHPPLTEPSWWQGWIGRIHGGAAILLFFSFAYFCFFRFTKSDKKRTEWDWSKRGSNLVYLVCGFVILGAIGWAFYALRNGRSIFLPEVLAVEAFALSWLIKGQALGASVRGARNLGRMAMDPRLVVAAVRERLGEQYPLRNG